MMGILSAFCPLLLRMMLLLLQQQQLAASSASGSSASSSTTATAAPIYVSSVAGRDNNTGFDPAHPLRSLPAAVHLARATHPFGSPPRRPPTIALAAGETFPLLEPLLLREDDSGLTITRWSRGAADVQAALPLISGGHIIAPSAWRRVGGGQQQQQQQQQQPEALIWEATIPTEARVLFNVTNLFLSARSNLTQTPGSVIAGEHHGPNLPSRRYRVRSKQMRWIQGIDPTNASNPSNGQGFVCNASDLPSSWDTSPAALATWRVFAYHSWSSSYHSVTSLTRNEGDGSVTIMFGEAAALSGAGPQYRGKRLLPAENVGCNQRFYIENVPELPLRVRADIIGHARINMYVKY